MKGPGESRAYHREEKDQADVTGELLPQESVGTDPLKHLCRGPGIPQVGRFSGYHSPTENRYYDRGKISIDSKKSQVLAIDFGRNACLNLQFLSKSGFRREWGCGDYAATPRVEQFVFDPKIIVRRVH